jgi:hypothetical protein
MYVDLGSGSVAELTITRASVVRTMLPETRTEGTITIDLPDGRTLELDDVAHVEDMIDDLADVMRATAAAVKPDRSHAASASAAALRDAAATFGAQYRDACATIGTTPEAMLRMFEASIAGSLRATPVQHVGLALVQLMRAALVL